MVYKVTLSIQHCAVTVSENLALEPSLSLNDTVLLPDAPTMCSVYKLRTKPGYAAEKRRKEVLFVA